MKKLFYLLLFTAITLQAQTTGINKLKIAANPEKTNAARVMVQDAATGEVGYINKTTLATSVEVNAKEPTITSGTTSQYYRGDKTWQTLDKTAVGLGNVDNTSDLNKPISTATQTALNAKQNTSEKNQINGYAGLGSDGKLISAQLPSITITDTFVVGSQSAMLALTAETGDVAVRTDLSKSYILKGTNPALLADWQELLSPVDGVTSVFGRVGSVTAQTGDYTTAQVTETTNKKYQTDAQALYNDATSSIQTQLNSKATDSNTVHKTGDETIAGIKTFSSLTNFSASGIKISTNGWLTPNQVYGETGNFFVNYSGTGNTIIGNSSGNVGIGTTSPNQLLSISSSSVGGSAFGLYNTASNTDNRNWALKLNGTNYGDLSFFVSSLNGGNPEAGSIAMTINKSGNVGIGTTSPNSYGAGLIGLTLDGSTTSFVTARANGVNKITLSANGGGGTPVLQANDATTALGFQVGGSERMRITSGGNTLIGTTTDDNYGKLAVNGNIVIPNSNHFLSKRADGMPLSIFKINSSNQLEFNPNYGQEVSSYVFGFNGTEKMRLTNSGNLGVGTTLPNYKLQVSPSATYGSAEDGNISINASAAGGTVSQPTTNGGIVFGDQNVTNGYSGRIAVIQDSPSSSTASHMRFYTNAGGGNTVTQERMRITANGNVGIGTISPINGGSAAKWITMEGNANYSGGLVASINGSAKAYFYSQDNFAIVQGASGQGVKLMPNGVDGVTVSSGGNVGIGTTSGTGKMRIDADGSVQDILQLRTLYASSGSRLISFINSGGSEIGSVQQSGSTVSYLTTSDYRLKEDLKSVNGLDLISKMKIYDYRWKEDKTRMYGVLAHELQEIVPYAVSGEKDGEKTQSVDYSKLVPILVQAIQELKAEIEILKNK